MAAYGLTFLQIVNRVLVRLRESTVAAHNTTDYSTQVGQMVNAVKAEIEGAWMWHPLRDTFSVLTSNGVSQYALTNAGSHAKIIDGWNITTGRQLVKGTNRSFNSRFFGVGSSAVQTGSPTHYLAAGVNVDYDLTVDVWPVPITGYLDSLKFNVYVPQDDLAADVTVPRVPQDLLIEETIVRMKAERGDEDAPRPLPGETFVLRDMLSQAIMADGGHDDTEFDWEPE